MTGRRGQTGRVPFGIYLHVPFCASRCDYCAFATWTDRHHLTTEYLTACRRQVEQLRPGMAAVTSVFVGGGTPSMVPAEELLAVLEPLPLVPGAEVTVECNPDTISGPLLDAYRRGGVTRLSLGAACAEGIATAGAVLTSTRMTTRRDNFSPVSDTVS